jgi:hypothetical protein
MTDKNVRTFETGISAVPVLRHTSDLDIRMTRNNHQHTKEQDDLARRQKIEIIRRLIAYFKSL